MPFVKFLSEDAGQPDIVRARADRLRGLPKQSQRILRDPSELTPAQREFIGSYVSGLNDCPH